MQDIIFKSNMANFDLRPAEVRSPVDDRLVVVLRSINDGKDNACMAKALMNNAYSGTCRFRYDFHISQKRNIIEDLYPMLTHTT